MNRLVWACVGGCGVCVAASGDAMGQEGALSEPSEAVKAEHPKFEFLRFEEDWSSLSMTDRDWYESIKHIPLDESGDSYLSIGGHTRARLEVWDGFAFGAPAVDDDEFLLWRAKLHGDFHFGEWIRVFVEGKSAESTDRDLPGGRRTLDVDTLELQQAFIDLKFRVTDDLTLTVRPGRQELKFGKQRLVSPLPWGNSLRHWDGVSAIFETGSTKIHAFWTQFTPTDKYEFNTADKRRDFYGVYGTTKLGSVGVDLYYLGFENDNGVAFNGTAGREERHTFGGRLFGTFGDSGFDYDLEGAYQTGRVGTGDVSAFMIGSQLGWTPEGWAWKPRVYVGFDYGSGDDSAGGDVETFNHLYPLGHAYLGYADFVGRQNIVDLSAGVKFSPAPKLTFAVDGHLFYRAEDADAFYNAGGGVVRAGGGSGEEEIGSEIDLTLSYAWNKFFATSLGYSRFFAGDFIEETGSSDDIDFFYVSAQLTF